MIIEVLDRIPKNSMLKEELISKLDTIPATFLSESIVLAKADGSYCMLKHAGVNSKYIWVKLNNSFETVHDTLITMEEVLNDIQRSAFQEILVLDGAEDLGRVLSGEYSKGK